MAVNLRVPSGIFVGGQPVRGEAELHFSQLLEDDVEEVHVKLRGSLFVKIERRVPEREGEPARERSRFETVHIVKENISVWNRKHSPAPAGQVTLVPFQFILPPNVLPSCEFSHGADERGTVGYFIEIVGVREGMLHRNRRVRRAIPVLPQDFVGAQLSRTLRSRLPYPTCTADTHKEIRRGIFGGHAKVSLQLTLPDFQAFPLFTPIPYTLRVVTVTKPEKYEKDIEHSDEPLFPAPPTEPKEVEFRLKRYISLHAGLESTRREDHVADLGGLGKHSEGTGVDVHVNERRWMPLSEPDGHHEGSWLQETTMQSAIVFTNPPGFLTEAMVMKYEIHVEVEFPGMGNNLEADIPIILTSSLPFIPDNYPEGAAPDYPQQGYPHALDLPKSYWELTDWGGDDSD